MIEKLLEIDRDVFLLLNQLHADWLDQPMFFLTNTLAWAPLFLVIVYFVIKEHGSSSWIFFVGIAIAILLSDQLTSTIIKPWFGRLRPSRDPSLAGMVHTVNNYIGGKYGFVSSHAANTFATATFIFTLLRKSRLWVITLFLWATFVCYTRIYLGVHYPGDLLVGGALGAMIGWLVVKGSLAAEQKIYPRSG